MEANRNFKKELIAQLAQLSDSASVSEIQKTTAGFFKAKIWKSRFGRKAFVISVILAVITIILVANVFLFEDTKIFDLIAYASWVLLPPSWFLLEYAWLFPDEARFDEDQLGDLKYKHELAGKIWAGLVVVLTAILYARYHDEIKF